MLEQKLNELFPPPNGAELRRISRTYWGWRIEFQAQLSLKDDHGSSLGNVTCGWLDESLDEAYTKAFEAFSAAVTNELADRKRKREEIASRSLAIEERFGNLDKIGPEV